LVAFAFVVAFAIGLPIVSRRQRRGLEELAEAGRAVACGELDRATKLLEPLRGDRNALIGAQAGLLLARVLEIRADFAAALRECDAASGRIAGPLFAASTHDILAPSLVSERAFVLAALGRDREADAELARLEREFPSFAYAPMSLFRTRMVLAARRGDLEAARRIARTRIDIAVSAYDDLLADLVLAAEADDDERSELLGTMRELPNAEAWLRVVAPGLPLAPAKTA
jgi:hypothetical protein